jgi:Phage tail lysozyme/D-alanyl-D-alanine carboxypeptidase
MMSAITRRFLLSLFLCLSVACLLVQTASPVLADSLPSSELKAINEYPNWVADACDSSGSTATGTIDVSSGMTTGGPTQADQKAVQEVVWGALKAAGLDDTHAAAVMGNIANEGVWDPESVENLPGLPPRSQNPSDAGQYGYGLIGWTPGASKTINSSLTFQMHELGLDSDPPYTAETQAAVIVAQIQGKTAAYAPSVGQGFLNTKTIEDATSFYEGPGGFENPADPAASQGARINSAKEMLALYGGTTGAPASPGAPTAGGSSCSCPSGGSATDTVTADSSLTGNTPAEQAFNYFVGKGMSPAGAAGLVGNFMSESGGNSEQLEPGITNSIGAHGIAQWLGGRLTSLNQFASSNSEQPDDLATQLDFAWHELNGDYKSVLDQIKNASDPAAAADEVNTNYEVSGVDPSTRETNAKKLFQEYGNGGGGGVVSDPSGGCPTDAAPTGDCSVTAPVWGSVHGAGDEYSQQQLTQIFGDPGTADSHPQMDANLTTVDFLGNSVQINKLAAPCLEAVAAQLKSENVDYKITEMGCYRFDSDNGGSNIGLLSYHTYGAACDINWDTNPWSGDGSEQPHDMPQAYIQAFHDHGFTWGGDWVSVKDFMHFEFNGIKPPS